MAPSGCIGDEALAAWAEGRATPAEVKAMTAHLAGCPECRAVVAALVRTEAPEPVRSASGRPGRGGSR